MPRKKPQKKGPWVPGKQAMPSAVAAQLGLPQERLKKGDFETEQVAIGHFRLREKSMLTHPSLLAERTNAKLRAYADQGKEPDQDIQITQTPSDRATAMWRHLLWKYLETRYENINGKSGSTKFEQSSRSSELGRLPLSEDQFNRRRFYEWLRKQPGCKSLTNLLDRVAAQCNPQAHDPDYPILSKAEIGAWRIDSDNPRDAKNACDGALAQACEHLAEMAAHYAALERQQKKAVGKKPNYV
jgi:hypothetical protein